MQATYEHIIAEAHPSAQVIGTDLSPIQPTDVPPNCSFEVDDAEDEWLFKKPFSYIHARAIISCFKDFPFVIRSAYKALLPGGILELQDPIFPLVFDKPYPPPDSPFVHFQKLIVEGTTKSGRPWAKSSQYKGWMEDSGFVNVHEEKFFLPVGSWCEGPKLRNIGAYYLTNWLEAFDAGTPRILSNLGWEVEESKILVAQVRDEFLKSNLRAYTHFWCVWVRKSELRAEAEAGGVAGAA